MQKFNGVVELPVDVNELNQFFVGDSNPNPIRDHRLIDTVPLDDQFYFSHAPAEDVVEAILFARSNAKGPDDIPVKFLKNPLFYRYFFIFSIAHCNQESFRRLGKLPSSALYPSARR